MGAGFESVVMYPMPVDISNARGTTDALPGIMEVFALFFKDPKLYLFENIAISNTVKFNVMYCKIQLLVGFSL